MKNIMNAVVAVSTAVLFCLIGLACAAMVVAKFNVYKKKHGENMTFVDYILDSERK